MTFPHFYNADPSLAMAIDGIGGIESEHDWYFDIDPNSGIRFGFQGSGQVSTYDVLSDAFP